MYTANDVEREYDEGWELEIIAKRWRASQKIDCGREIGIKRLIVKFVK